MSEFAFTHVALIVADLDASTSFYQRYAGLRIVDERREPSGSRVAWLSDPSEAFVLVLVAPHRLPWRCRISRALARWVFPSSHLGVECPSRQAVESLCELARKEGILRQPIRDQPPPTGFYGMIADPDANTLELSYGQVTRSALKRRP